MNELLVLNMFGVIMVLLLGYWTFRDERLKYRRELCDKIKNLIGKNCPKERRLSTLSYGGNDRRSS